MKNKTDILEKILTASTRAELRSRVGSLGVDLNLPQANAVIKLADTLEPAKHELKLGIIHTYTSDLLDPWLSLEAALQGLDLKVYHAPYGLSLQEAHAKSNLIKHEPDLTLLLLQPEDLHPELQNPLPMLAPLQQDELRDQVRENLAGVVNRFRSYPVGQIVVTLLPALYGPSVGVYDSQSERSERVWWNKLKSEIGRYLLESVQSAFFLDLDDIVLQMGRRLFFDYRLWYSARFPFSYIAAREVSRRVVGLGANLVFPKAKVIVLDADNTLWGGIIGEEGINGIALGPEYPGNAFVDFQKRLLGFQQRGFILALCSKNNPSDLDQVLQEHPHQILRDQHFAARRVNWKSKPENIISIAEELNLGLDSFVFVDDSDHECAIVRHRLPQLEVIQTPSRPIDIPRCLDHVAKLEVMSLTSEDLAKTTMYIQDRKRRELKGSFSQTSDDMDDYLRSLDMCIEIGLDDRRYINRFAQLTQKTNQFNLTTRRYDEKQIESFIDSEDWLVFHFSLIDIFGDSGIVGLALLKRIDPQQMILDTFLMSCRVIGRKAESAFLQAILRHLKGKNIHSLVAEYLPTRKNILVEKFLSDEGFETEEDNQYVWGFSKICPKSGSVFPISVKGLDDAHYQ